MPITNVPASKRGDPLSANLVNGITSRLTPVVTGGKNIVVRRVGQKLVIDCTAPYTRGGRGGLDVLVAPSFAALGAGRTLRPGMLGYTEDHGNLYGYTASGWRVLHAFATATPPSGIGERDGDRWANGDYVYVLQGGDWSPLPKLVNGKGYLPNGTTPDADLLLFTHLE